MTHVRRIRPQPLCKLTSRVSTRGLQFPPLQPPSPIPIFVGLPLRHLDLPAATLAAISARRIAASSTIKMPSLLPVPSAFPSRRNPQPSVPHRPTKRRPPSSASAVNKLEGQRSVVFPLLRVLARSLASARPLPFPIQTATLAASSANRKAAFSTIKISATRSPNADLPKESKRAGRKTKNQGPRTAKTPPLYDHNYPSTEKTGF